MDKKTLSVLKKVINLEDTSCTHTSIYTYTYNAGGEFLRSEIESVALMDTLDAEETQKTIGMCFSGTVGKTINAYPIFKRVYDEDKCTANTVRDIYDYACANGTIDETMAREYADVVAKGLVAHEDNKPGVIACNRGVTAFTIHMLQVTINPELSNKKRKTKLPETAHYAHNRSYFITWVDTITTEHAKTLVEQEDGTMKMVRVDRPVISTKPIVSVVYPSVTDEDIDRTQMLFYSKNRNASFVNFVRNTYDCDVRPTVDEAIERYDTLMEEIVGGIMPFEFKATVYDTIVDYRETFPTKTIANNQLHVTLSNGFITPDTVEQSTAIDDFYKAVLADNTVPVDAFINKPHKIDIPAINGRLTFKTDGRISDVVKVEDGEMGSKWLCIKVDDAQVVFDDVPVIMEETEKFYAAASEITNVDGDPYGIKRIELAYEEYKKTHTALTRIDFDSYEREVQRRAIKRSKVLQEYKQATKDETTARRYVRDEKGELKYRHDRDNNPHIKCEERRRYIAEATKNVQAKMKAEREEGLENYTEFVNAAGEKALLPDNVGEYMLENGVTAINDGGVVDLRPKEEPVIYDPDEAPPAGYIDTNGETHLNF